MHTQLDREPFPKKQCSCLSQASSVRETDWTWQCYCLKKLSANESAGLSRVVATVTVESVGSRRRLRLSRAQILDRRLWLSRAQVLDSSPLSVIVAGVGARQFNNAGQKAQIVDSSTTPVRKPRLSTVRRRLDG